MENKGKRMWQKVGSKSWMAIAVIALALSMDNGSLVTASEAEVTETEVTEERFLETVEEPVYEEWGESNVLPETNQVPEVIQIIERTVPLFAGIEYIEISELPDGEEQVVQVGQDGYRVEVYEQLVINNVIQNETLIDIKEEVKAQDEIIEFGIAVVPETVTQTRVEKETTPFETVEEENADLPVGIENLLQEGIDYIVEVTYEDTYEDGEVVETIEVDRTVFQEGQDEVIEVGTQEEPVVPDDAATLKELAKEPKTIKYEKATQGTVDQPNDDGSHTILAPSPHNEIVSDPYSLTPEMIDYYKDNVNVNALNQEFGKLLNGTRMAQGKKPVTYMPEYQAGVDTRANELASIGNIRVDNQPHVRLDGRPFDTAYDYLGKNKGGLGENLAGMNYDGNPYELLSERFLAEQAYIQWLNSPGHKINQEDPMYDGYAFSVAPVSNVGWTDSVYNSGYVAALGLVAK